MTANPDAEGSRMIEAAREAIQRGYQPVPIRAGSKAPSGSSWTHRVYTDETVKEFENAAGIGLRTGEVSGGLVDVDLDHPTAWKLRHLFLPPTAMRSGRIGNADSHYWYRVTDDLPGYRKYTFPEGETAVELRSSSGHQTLIPPSTWYPKKGAPGTPEAYRWEGAPWGGTDGPSEINGKVLAARVATLALVAVLIENWPEEGSRHDAYLALAGGMLRYGKSNAVHPYWGYEGAFAQIVEAIAEITHDDDGPGARVSEVVNTTIAKIESGARTQGWGTLATIIGHDFVDMAQKRVRDIEVIIEWEKFLAIPSATKDLSTELIDMPDDAGGEGEQSELGEGSEIVPASNTANPLDARGTDTWQPVNLEAYLSGEVVVPDPTILRRSDGKGIFYPGRVNSLYGKSESAKSWVAAYACLQEIEAGSRVIYVDLEDDPAMQIERLVAMGGGPDDIRSGFTYVRPEGPHMDMQRDRWGNEVPPSDVARQNARTFAEAVRKIDPSMIIVDGMSVLYGLHNLNTNDVASTDVITNWLKKITRNGRTTVIIIDHTSKGADKGSGPIGSQHKISMVQGTAIQVHVIDQPMPGRKGHLELVVGKDRPGRVRKIANNDKNQVVADVYLDSTEEGVTRVSILPPTPGDVVVADSEEANKRLGVKGTLMRAVEDVFRNHPGAWLAKRHVADAIAVTGYSTSSFDRAFTDLRKSNVIERRGDTKSSEYRLVEARVEERTKVTKIGVEEEIVDLGEVNE